MLLDKVYVVLATLLLEDLRCHLGSVLQDTDAAILSANNQELVLSTSDVDGVHDAHAAFELPL